jgi:gas vesicle protein
MTTQTKDAKETKKRSVWLGIAIGGAVGAVSAMLVAPKSGKETRENISNKYQDISDKTKEQVSNVGQKTQEVAEKVSGQISSLADRVKKVEKDAEKDVKRAVN